MPLDPTSAGAAATAATPVLASTLFATLVQQKQRLQIPGLARFRTGCASLDDEVLDGGLEPGIVCGVSAGLEEGVGRLVTLHILATTLISNSSVTATVIDSTGFFPILLLSQVLRYCVSEKVELARRRGVRDEAAEQKDIDETVESCLERVAISRVFDIEGVWEVLSEVGRRCEKAAAGESVDVLSNEAINDVSAPLGGLAHPNPAEATNEKTQTEMEVVDSEDEDDEMLLSPSQEPSHSEEVPKELSTAGNKDARASDAKDEPSNPSMAARADHTVLVIIDDMTSLTSALLSKTEKALAHTILRTLSRALHSLARTHNLLLLLLNDLTTPKPNTYTPRPPRRPTSIFSSTTSHPALGSTFNTMLDLHLFITSVPLRRVDAEALYGDGSNSNETKVHKSNSTHVHYAYVLEVLHDATPRLGFLLDDDDDSMATTTGSKLRSGDLFASSPQDIWERMRVGARKKRRREQRWGAVRVVEVGGVGVGIVRAG